MRNFKTGLMVSVTLLALTACNAGDRLAQLGDAPPLAPVENPARNPEVAHVEFPQPEQKVHVRQANSLWEPGARAFFKDQRAGKVGDILTVIIQVSDSADIKNETKRARTTAENDNVTNLLGFETKLNKIFPNAVDPTALMNYGGKTQNDGTGQISRADKVNLRVAAVITQVMPNGNMVIYGKQQMNVNYDQRELKVTGVIRPEDISSANSINYDQIAEARISYGGQGQIMDVQQARYGTQLMDIVFPF